MDNWVIEKNIIQPKRGDQHPKRKDETYKKLLHLLYTMEEGDSVLFATKKEAERLRYLFRTQKPPIRASVYRVEGGYRFWRKTKLDRNVRLAYRRQFEPITENKPEKIVGDINDQKLQAYMQQTGCEGGTCEF